MAEAMTLHEEYTHSLSGSLLILTYPPLYPSPFHSSPIPIAVCTSNISVQAVQITLCFCLSQRAVLKFAHYTGAVPIAGRYTPGMFTNQIQAKFREPRLLIVSDPRYDHQVCHCVCTCGRGGGRGGYTFYHCVCTSGREGTSFIASLPEGGESQLQIPVHVLIQVAPSFLSSSPSHTHTVSM